MTKAVDLKQIRLGMRIGENDLDIKTNKIRKFLEAGHKVKVMLLYRGRENAHKDLGFTLFERITQKLEDIALVDQSAQLNGRNLTITYRKNPAAKVAPKVKNDNGTKNDSTNLTNGDQKQEL